MTSRMGKKDDDLTYARGQLAGIAKAHGREANFVNCRVCERKWPCNTYTLATAKPVKGDCDG